MTPRQEIATKIICALLQTDGVQQKIDRVAASNSNVETLAKEIVTIIVDCGFMMADEILKREP